MNRTIIMTLIAVMAALGALWLCALLTIHTVDVVDVCVKLVGKVVVGTTSLRYVVGA